MASFVSQLMAPGGGIILIPFIRIVIILLMLTTSTTFVFGVARLHMGILTVLSGGLLISLSFFESEYKKAVSTRNKNNAQISGNSAKTD
jgi:ABC-type transport system involved in multi-copper enzyme maturation permease subunit